MRPLSSRAAIVTGIIFLALLMPVLQACDSVADPSPRADNAQTFNYPGYQSIGGRVISLAATSDGAHVYAGTLRGGLWRSDDGGANWQQITGAQPGDNTRGCVDADPRCSLPGATVSDVLVASDNPNIVIVAIAQDGAGQALDGIYRSENGGKTWARVFQFTCEGNAQPVTQLQFAPDDTKRRRRDLDADHDAVERACLSRRRWAIPEFGTHCLRLWRRACVRLLRRRKDICR
jgi:hypothetical protein